MSIPKEPRQIMINIMYLVLTALLALNVSAEIFNAFKMIDRGLNSAAKSLDDKNAKMAETIIKNAEANKRYEKYKERVPLAQQYSKELTDYIDSIITYLIDQTGNKNGVIDEGDKRYDGEWKGIRDKDITTRYLVDQGKGEELKRKILEYREKFLALADSGDVEKLEPEIPLVIDDTSWKKSRTRRRNWADFVFNHMPVGATIPILTKFKTDAKNAESAVLSYLFDKVGGGKLELENFFPLSSPKKSYVVVGEPYETEISLGASAGESSKAKIEIFVNGQQLPTQDGVAKWRVIPKTVGVKKYTVTIRLTNPVTKEVKEFSKTFEYEVGQRSVSISLDKMNVFYIGVDNPITVSASGVSTNALQVKGEGITITPDPNGGAGDYIVRANKPGKAKIILTANGQHLGTFEYRVKRIPDPTPMLGKYKGGVIGNGTFKAFNALRAALPGFDFDAKCRIVGFRMVRLPKRKDPQIADNKGGKYGSEALRLRNLAKPGDKFFFENIKAKCPGDKAARTLSQMVFNIR